MHTVLIILLALNVAFNCAVWPQFVRRVNADERSRDAAGRPTKFLRVHRVLFAAVGVVTLVSLAGVVAALVA
ncbi:SCO4848 family membrane protein [Rarobacter incanus]|uniref:Integral membrane protein n=1 Tax=Rarobacter incanus TaxID=153494 RepID=A0A542SMW6_9MICO|nr:hypothetical protein [Rarobacter incanus]TQK75969.1 hypothetical protein FB389_0613 [Rarobacter incanus]